MGWTLLGCSHVGTAESGTAGFLSITVSA